MGTDHQDNQLQHDSRAIGKRLRAARLQAEGTGQPQAWLARRLSELENSHVDPTQISNLESGKRLPSVDRLCRLCRILKCSADYLLGATPPITVPRPGDI